jgi:hypothetical protein
MQGVQLLAYISNEKIYEDMRGEEVKVGESDEDGKIVGHREKLFRLMWGRFGGWGMSYQQNQHV